MTGTDLALLGGQQVDQAAVLKTLNLNPADPHTHAVLLICQKYGLDPLLKHVVLIQGRPYITRDGYLHHAHESGQFDGIEIVDEGETADCWWAKAAVYRKDMARPFTYRGRYPKRNAGNPKYGPEMAIKTAEVMALRRAFNVAGLPAADEQWDTPEPDAPTLSVAAAKTRLVAIAAGDKEAAAAAWEKAGLKDRTAVSEADLAAAEDELRALGWAWMPTDPGYEAPDGDDGDDHGPGEAADGDAVDSTSTEPADAGRVDVDTSPGPSTRQPPRTITSTAVRMLSEEVFAAEATTAPRGHKTKVIPRLRHALIHAETDGAASSTVGLDPAVLLAVWERLNDVTAGRLAYELQVDVGVTWVKASGDRLTVTWAELEGDPEEAA